MVPDRLIFRSGDIAGIRVRRGFRARLGLQTRNHLLCASSVPPRPGTSIEWSDAGFSEWRDVDANNPLEVACVVDLMATLLPERMRGRPRIGE